MRLVRLLIIFTHLFWTTAYAQESPNAESQTAARELFSFMSEQLTADVVKSMSDAMWPTFIGSVPKKIDPETEYELKSEFQRVLKKYIDRSMERGPAIYARHFTADELKEMISIYRSPLGQKMLRETPKVTGEFVSSALLPIMPSMESEMKSSIEYVLRKHNYMK